MTNRVLQRIGKAILVCAMGAGLLSAISVSGQRVKASEADCADYVCAADDECKNHECDACGKDKRCLKAPLIE